MPSATMGNRVSGAATRTVRAASRKQVCDDPDHRRAAESELSLLSFYVKRQSAAEAGS